MNENPHQISHAPHPLVDALPATRTFTINKGDWLGSSRVAKGTHGGFDSYTDTQPHVEVLDPNSGELKTAVVGVHKAIQLKLQGRKEPFVHS